MSNSLINSTTQIDTTLTKDGYAADAKVTGDRLKEKANYANAVYCDNAYSGQTYMFAISNIGTPPKTVDLVFNDTETFAFVIGAGSHGYNIVSMVGGGDVVQKDFGSPITATKDQNIVHLTLPNWFRGVMISYNKFSVNGL